MGARKTLQNLTCALLLMSSFAALSQPISLSDVVYTTTSQARVGEPVTIIARSPDGCQGFHVNSWSFGNETPSTTLSSAGTDQSFYATYASTGDKLITASFGCSIYTDPTTHVVTPGYNNSDAMHVQVHATSCDLTFSVTKSVICETEGLTFKAENLVNPGQNPQFTFMIDGNTVYQAYMTPDNQGTVQYTKSAPLNLSAGTHTASVIMFSSETQTPSPERSMSFLVKAQSMFSIDFMRINDGVICSTDPTAHVQVGVHDPEGLGEYLGENDFRYRWFYNDGFVGQTFTPYFTYTNVQDGKSAYVIINDMHINTTNCEQTVVDNSATPLYFNVTTGNASVSIIASKTPSGPRIAAGEPICDGTTIYLRSSQEGSSYSWQNSNFTSLPSTKEIQVKLASSGTQRFLSSGTMFLGVTGITAACVSGTVNANATLYGSDFTLKPLPAASVTPSGVVWIKSNGSTSLSAPASGSGESQLSYQWQKSDDINNPSWYNFVGEVNQIVNANSEALYRVVLTSYWSCVASSAATTVLRNHVPVLTVDPESSFSLPNPISITAGATDVDGGSFTWLWTKLSGPPATLTGATTPTLALTDAAVGVYRFRVTVTDNHDESVSSDVTIYVYPADNYNYVKENVVTIANVTDANNAKALSIGNRLQTTTYFDGFGRPSEKIAMMGTPAMKDLVQPYEYDVFGREKRTYLPYPTTQTAGVYIPNPLQGTTGYKDSPHQGYYQTAFSDSIGYSQSEFDSSPLNRVVGQSSPGLSWKPGSAHTIQKSYLVNVAHEVLFFNYNESTGELTLPANTQSDNAYYPANVLYCTTALDEDQHEVREYKDREGRLVCRKVLASSGVYASTYYIYDDFGHLVVVIPPEGLKAFINGN